MDAEIWAQVMTSEARRFIETWHGDPELLESDPAQALNWLEDQLIEVGSHNLTADELEAAVVSVMAYLSQIIIMLHGADWAFDPEAGRYVLEGGRVKAPIHLGPLVLRKLQKPHVSAVTMLNEAEREGRVQVTTPPPDQRPDEATLEYLRAVFEPQWRMQPLGYRAVEAWESEYGAVLPEPYRTVVAEICNGYSLGPPADGGLERLGCVPLDWPVLGPREPGAQFPLTEAWVWEDDDDVDPDEDPRIDSVFSQGSVVLGSEDGQSFWILVTTGPRRGEVWTVGGVGAVPAHRGDAWGFLEWVRQWHTAPSWLD